jgi:hypothetical protein
MSHLQGMEKSRMELRVNDTAIRSVSFRISFEEPDDFDILISDLQLGSLALTNDCDLEVREAGARWRRVTLDQLKSLLVDDNKFLEAGYLTATRRVERKRFDRLDDINVPHRTSPRLSALTGRDACTRRVQQLLDKARILHRVAGTVFLVPSAREARIALSLAGFHQSTISPSALVEPESRCAIQLIETRWLMRRSDQH